MDRLNATVAVSASGKAVAITLPAIWLESLAAISEVSEEVGVGLGIFAHKHPGRSNYKLLTAQETISVESLCKYIGPDLERIDCFYRLLCVKVLPLPIDFSALNVICSFLGAKPEWIIDLRQPFDQNHVDTFASAALLATVTVEQLFAELSHQ